jgi:hypothetical protein
MRDRGSRGQRGPAQGHPPAAGVTELSMARPAIGCDAQRVLGWGLPQTSRTGTTSGAIHDTRGWARPPPPGQACLGWPRCSDQAPRRVGRHLRRRDQLPLLPDPGATVDCQQPVRGGRGPPAGRGLRRPSNRGRQRGASTPTQNQRHPGNLSIERRFREASWLPALTAGPIEPALVVQVVQERGPELTRGQRCWLGPQGVARLPRHGRHTGGVPPDRDYAPGDTPLTGGPRNRPSPL